jgi:hypothetical protein
MNPQLKLSRNIQWIDPVAGNFFSGKLEQDEFQSVYIDIYLDGGIALVIPVHAGGIAALHDIPDIAQMSGAGPGKRIFFQWFMV